MVVDPAARLHQRVRGRRPDEAKPAPLQLASKRVRLISRGWDVVERPQRGAMAAWSRRPQELVQRRAGVTELDRGAGVRDRRFDLRQVAYDAGVGEQALV